MRTLIIAPNWIGDAVMAQPLLGRIRQGDPSGTIDVLAPAHVAPVFEAMAEVAQVHRAPHVHGRLQLRERLAVARRLRRERYDRCYLLPNSLKSALIPWLAGIPRRIGHRGEARYLLVNEIHEPPAGDHARAPMVEFYAQLALSRRDPLPSGVAAPVLVRDPEREAAVRHRYGLAPDAPLIVLCPGAEYGPAKRWPARHVAALAAQLAVERPDAVVVLLGSAKERALATEILALSGRPLKNLCGDTSLADALALVAQAAGVVSNDSGLMHVAAAYGRPQVAVFGSSDPRHTPPRSPLARVEWLHLECSPCFARECALGHTDCLNRIAPATVLAALMQAMRSETLSRPPR